MAAISQEQGIGRQHQHADGNARQTYEMNYFGMMDNAFAIAVRVGLCAFSDDQVTYTYASVPTNPTSRLTQFLLDCDNRCMRILLIAAIAVSSIMAFAFIDIFFNSSVLPMNNGGLSTTVTELLRDRYRKPPVIINDRGKRLGWIFDGVGRSETFSRVNASYRMRRRGVCKPAKSTKARALSFLFTPFTVQTVLACDADTECYDHYAVLQYNDCNPACYGEFVSYYDDSSQNPNYQDGAHLDGTGSCTPLCSEICNYARCNNP